MSDCTLRQSRVMAAVVAAVVAVVVALPAAARGPVSVADVAAPLLDAVVNISTAQTVTGSRGRVPTPRLPPGSPFQDFFDDFFDQKQDDGDTRPRRVESLGSGFVIDASGIIVTNNHVIEGADEIAAIFNDGRRLVATLIGHDDKTDLAVLKVEADEPLTAVEFGDSSSLRVGDWVMAVGNPFGLGGSVSLGIVSARNRDINSGPYDDFIQTDAAINRGNSGGPLFNMDGKVIGINTAIISPSGGSIGIGFAVPAEIAVGIIDQLREFGETRRGWLGVRIQDVTDELAKDLEMESVHGALVAGVDESGPAAEGGILAGDVIVEFDGTVVDAMHGLPRMVADRPVGKQVQVVVVRDGKEEKLEIRLGRLEEAEQLAAAAATDEPEKGDEPAVVTGPLGLTLADLSPAVRDKYRIKAEVTAGVVVTGVSEGSTAERRLQPGDVIVEISQEPVLMPEDVGKRIADLREQGRKSVRLVLQDKDGIVRWVDLSLVEEPAEPEPAPQQ